MEDYGKIDVVFGLQFGDEGKGKIVDYLCSTGAYDVCARVNGSDNAGHSVIIDGDRLVFQQVPIGALHGMACIIARGCIVDLAKLNDEIARVHQFIDKHGLPEGWVLFLDERCHVKTQEHRDRDAAEERGRGKPIGTTLSGNGPAHADKYGRKNLRVCDTNIYEYTNIINSSVICDTSHPPLDIKRKILVEGAHGIMLDIDHGTYPFVSSSGCTPAAACHSLGMSPKKLDRLIGVMKPYLTRVGAGAFPSEMHADSANFWREKGKEYGSVTGRPRRMGWLDLQALRYAVRISGATEIALTKVDLLDPSVLVVSEYDREWDPKDVPARDDSLVMCAMKSLDVRKLVGEIEETTGLRISIISNGSGRDQIEIP
jgi:adenylosuccinate synthase